mmetsp:Transcript_26548/g.64168  ORF Transcript_26548/g.64168 Transcript_26548/m.64168 type:complete len:285 (-) Transcript_26548:131-985(-)
MDNDDDERKLDSGASKLPSQQPKYSEEQWRRAIKEYDEREAKRQAQSVEKGNRLRQKEEEQKAPRAIDYSKWEELETGSVSPPRTSEEEDDPTELRWDLTDPDESDLQLVQGTWWTMNTTGGERKVYITGRCVTGISSGQDALYTRKSTGKLWVRGFWLDRERSDSDLLRWKTGKNTRYNMLGGTVWVRVNSSRYYFTPTSKSSATGAGNSGRDTSSIQPIDDSELEADGEDAIPAPPMVKQTFESRREEELERAKKDGARVFRSRKLGSDPQDVEWVKDIDPD